MLESLIVLAITVYILMAANTLVNAWVLSQTGQPRAGANQKPETSVGRARPSLSILVPARNEERNLQRLISSFLRQDNDNAELVIYDDESEDNTWGIIQENASERVRGISGGAVPEGWLGKVNACRRLAEEARGDTFLFLDADTEFLHDSAVSRFSDLAPPPGAPFVVTGVPDGRGSGLVLLGPVAFCILSCLPWWLGSRHRPSRLSALNGQCWMISREWYRKLEPHVAVRGEVLEDIMIGRYLASCSVGVQLVNVRRDLAVYMYASFREAWKGFLKNAAAGLGRSSTGAAASLTLFLLIFLVAPFFVPVLWAVQLLLRFVTDRISGFPPLHFLLAPVGFTALAVLSAQSIYMRASGRTMWKGRRVVRSER